jgi:hypothetical protein
MTNPRNSVRSFVRPMAEKTLQRSAMKRRMRSMIEVYAKEENSFDTVDFNVAMIDKRCAFTHVRQKSGRLVDSGRVESQSTIIGGADLAIAPLSPTGVNAYKLD